MVTLGMYECGLKPTLPLIYSVTQIYPTTPQTLLTPLPLVGYMLDPRDKKFKYKYDINININSRQHSCFQSSYRLAGRKIQQMTSPVRASVRAVYNELGNACQVWVAVRNTSYAWLLENAQ